MDPLEDRLRESLSGDRWRLPTDPDVLDRVHAGAERRRRRKVAITTAAAAVVLVGAGAGGIGYVMNGVHPAMTSAGGSSESAEKSGPDTMLDRSEEGGAATPGEPPEGSDSAPDGAQDPGPERGRTEKTPEPTLGAALAPVPADFAPVSLTAASERRFWVLGGPTSAGEGGRDDATVAVTDDGGATFGILATLDAPLVSGDNEVGAGTVRDLRFAGDGSNGWAYGGGLWSTHDGGGSWARVTAVTGLVERLETAGGATYALARDGDAWTLWRTPVDHEAWRQVDIALTDPDGLAVTSDLVAVADRTEDRTDVWVSTDGGTAFDQRTTPCEPSLDAGRLSATTGSLWLTCPTGTAASVHVSTDAGASWTKVPSGVPALSATATELGARSASRAVAAVPGEALTLTSGGTTRTPVPGLGNPAFAGFTSDRVGYILDLEGHLFRTVDGGAAWTRVTVR